MNGFLTQNYTTKEVHVTAEEVVGNDAVNILDISSVRGRGLDITFRLQSSSTLSSHSAIYVDVDGGISPDHVLNVEELRYIMTNKLPISARGKHLKIFHQSTDLTLVCGEWSVDCRFLESLKIDLIGPRTGTDTWDLVGYYYLEVE